MTLLTHCKRSRYDIYIGRPRLGKQWGFGNPFDIGRDGDRSDVISKFEVWLTTGETFGNRDATEARRQWMWENLPSIRGKVIGCWCYPKPCHGHVLIQLAEQQAFLSDPS